MQKSDYAIDYAIAQLEILLTIKSFKHTVKQKYITQLYLLIELFEQKFNTDYFNLYNDDLATKQSITLRTKNFIQIIKNAIAHIKANTFKLTKFKKTIADLELKKLI